MILAIALLACLTIAATVTACVCAWRYVNLRFDRLERKEKSDDLARFAAQIKTMNEESVDMVARAKSALEGKRPHIVPLRPNGGDSAA